eukprot:TRINITY_DN4817_c0_g1_i1.p1 TRINITY_DN4817_c0_g1~~TRINITY_DN4817_c0_g1_i1.p1  ORF type:complete len:353 (+),score=45.77 TRINITY_DN4817_c0_g1_i1:44-1060(+)
MDPMLQSPHPQDKTEQMLPETQKARMKTILVDSAEKGETKRARLADFVKLPAKEGAWPMELILVRHGQSEGNEAVARSKKGDLSAYTPDFKKKHSSSYRLTDKGVEQAKVAGKWIKENISENFDRYYTSEYVRAMETASLLGLPNAKWYTEIVLRERDKGLLDNVSWVERNEKYGEEMERRKRDSFFWAPLGGESMANICNRIDHTFNTLRRECSGQRVIIVCHGEVMWAFRCRIERLSQIRFHQLQSSPNKKDGIHNTQVLHYSRVHPTTGEVFPYFKYLRSVCPWKPQNSHNEWFEFDRPTYSNDELMASVQTVPRFVNNTHKASEDDDDDTEVAK